MIMPAYIAYVMYYSCVLSFVIPIIHSYLYYKRIVSVKVEDERMNSVATSIRVSAQAYLKKQYTYVFGATLLIAVAMWPFFANKLVVAGFIGGSVLSGICGILGMHIAIISNVRTAEKAKIGLKDAFMMSLNAGKATGLLIGGIAMMCVSLCFFMFIYSGGSASSTTNIIDLLLGLSLGASLVSVFARLGGGIFTKAADVGADLVGKVEQGIPEDDPRNPAVIADNVGDNVGDCAGTSADLFETYIVGFMSVFSLTVYSRMDIPLAFFFYIAISCSMGCYFALISTCSMRSSPLKTLFYVLVKSALISTLLCYILVSLSGISPVGFMLTFMIGLVCTFLLVFITHYYTSSNCSPVKKIARASESGHAMNIISGLAVSMESCFANMIAIAMLMMLSNYILGYAGICVSVMSMLGMIMTIIALDAYGPITDNAGGIVEMSGQDSKVREVTDELDALGNTTKALTKGYAVGSTVLAAVTVISLYMLDAYIYKISVLHFTIKNVYVIAGMLVGGAIVYWYSALAMESVANVGQEVVKEVREQFKNNPEIIKGNAAPDYERTINLLTSRSIRGMFKPIIMVFGTIAAFFTFCVVSSSNSLSPAIHNAFAGIGGLIVGVTMVGSFLAVSMTIGGGAWDNAKKYIEQGNHGGKGSDAHKAAVTGDTVGDPYKDTAGPALNPMIKMVNIIAVLLLKILCS
ncbi:MAG: sodium-translocating pyrophosphatase [Alphaproteobacteria bacterium]|nr:MAG: sodium-translocating pyrophosphatase [Alphaproteobacteria bacterium]